MMLALETNFEKGMKVRSKLDPENKFFVVSFSISGYDSAGQVTNYTIGCSNQNSESFWFYEFEIEEDK